MNHAHSQQTEWEPGIAPDATFGAIASSIAGISEKRLQTLVPALDWVPTISPGLLVWLQHLVDWELRRRTGSHISLRRPVMWPGEETESLIAATLFHAQFDCDGKAESEPLLALFAAIIQALKAHNVCAVQ